MGRLAWRLAWPEKEASGEVEGRPGRLVTYIALLRSTGRVCRSDACATTVLGGALGC